MAGISIDTSTVENATDSTSKKNNSSLDKDSFLQLLVTQMQYQDPLEPTSNTEYMSQLAQFSSVEQMQNLNTLVETNRSLNMAGQYVILNVPDSSGNTTQVTGLIDYVTLKEGKPFFHINDQYYSADYLDSIVNMDYLEYLQRQVTEQDSDSSGETAGDGTDNTENTDGTGEL